MHKQFFARHVARRGLMNSRRQRDGARYRMLGETLEPRSMLAVTASVTSGTLNIVLGTAGDAAFLSYGGSSYTLTNGTGVPVSGSPFSGVTAAVSVAAGAGNQSFTFNGSTALPVSLTVDSAVEATSISTAINASGLATSTVSISSPVITLAADISTTGVQTYVGAVQLAGSPSLTSSNGAVTFKSTVDAYLDFAMAPSYANQTTFTTGDNPVSVSIGDFNGDGKPDLAIANYVSNTVSVLLNTTAPGATTPSYANQATFATGISPNSVSIGDFNGDGKPDLAIVNRSSYSVSVLLNTTAPGATTPSFANQATFATGNIPRSVSIGDFNGDGKPDLAIANFASASVSVLLNTTAPGATTPSYANQATFATGISPNSVSIGDFNGDGKLDLAIANSTSNSVSVLLNTTAPGAPTPTYANQTMFATGSLPKSVSIGDFNGDGKPDLAIANYASNSVGVLLNTTDTGATTPSYASQATFVTGNLPFSVSIGDFNGDGKPDLALANGYYASNSVSVLLNTTAPGATTPSYANQATFATGSNPFSVSIGDFNGDGKPDLAIANSTSNSVSVLLNTTDSGAPTPSYASQTTFATGDQPLSVSIGDFNGDGKPDLAIANIGSNSVSVLLNTTAPGAVTPSYASQATFATRNAPKSVSIGDFNGDGKPDLAIVNSSSYSVSVLLNTTAPGAATPSYANQTEFTTGDNPVSVSIGDFNGDGKPDLAIANYDSDSVSVLLNTTDPGATKPSYAHHTEFATGSRPRSVSIGDFNGDGRPDLAIANFYSNSVGVFLNTTAPGATTPSYANPVAFATSGNPISVSIGDFNGDGKPDLAIANYVSNSVSVLLNTTAPGATTPSYANQATFATGSNPFSVSIGDLSGDGKPDLAIANRDSNSVSVLLNTTAPGATTPSYANQATFATGSNPFSVSIGDFNGDGKPDLAIVNSTSNSVSVLLNAPTPGNLTVSSLTGTTFAAPVGGTTPLGSLAIANGPTSLGGSVTTTGAAGQVYRGPVQLGVDVTINSGDAATAGPVTFSSTVDSLSAATPVNLSVKASGRTLFGGTVGGTNPLNNLWTEPGYNRTDPGNTRFEATTTPSVTTVGIQFYADNVILAKATQLVSTANGGISFGQKVVSASGLASTLEIVSAGTTTFSDSVGGALNGTSALGGLTTGTGATVIHGATVYTSGAAGQVYRGPVQLGVDLTINSGDAATAGPVTFSSTVDTLAAVTPVNLALKASGRTLFGGTVGGTNPLNNLWTNPGYNRTDPGNTRFEATTTPSVTTVGSQVYSDGVILAKNTQLVSTANGGISFGQKVVSTSGLASTLEIVTAGTTTFSDSVGGALNGTLALGGLTTGTGATVIHGATVYTSGAAGQVYRGPVLLGVDLTINSGDAATAGPVTFSSTVDTLAAVTPVNLAVKASGPTRFSGAVGKVGPFASLSTAVDTRQPAGTTFIDGGCVATVGDAGQSYIDKVVLGADTSFTSGPRGAIVFSDSLDGAAKATFTAGGALIFFQKVGGATPLRGISIKSASSVFAAQSVVLNGADNAAADDGLVIGAGVNAVTIAAAGSSFNGFRGNGIVFSGGSTNSLLSGFDVKNNGASAIAIGAGSYSGTVLQGMTISGNKNGLWLDAAKEITIKTNHVISNTAFGLYAKGLSTGTTVTGNTLSGNGTNIDTTAATGGTFQTS